MMTKRKLSFELIWLSAEFTCHSIMFFLLQQISKKILLVMAYLTIEHGTTLNAKEKAARLILLARQGTWEANTTIQPVLCTFSCSRVYELYATKSNSKRRVIHVMYSIFGYFGREKRVQQLLYLVC